MAPEQRQKQIEKVHQISFSAEEQPCLTSVMSSSSKRVSIKWETAKSEHVYIQRLQDMWQKVEQLFNTTGFALPAAGNPEMSRQVASLPNQGPKNVPPHFVLAEARKIGTEVRCNCPVYRSSPNICQHALAAAEDLGVLPKFLQWVRKIKKCSQFVTIDC